MSIEELVDPVGQNLKLAVKQVVEGDVGASDLEVDVGVGGLAGGLEPAPSPATLAAWVADAIPTSELPRSKLSLSRASRTWAQAECGAIGSHRRLRDGCDALLDGGDEVDLN